MSIYKIVAFGIAISWIAAFVYHGIIPLAGGLLVLVLAVIAFIAHSKPKGPT